ncbi:pseudouridine synthase [Uliginosibacterium sp. sgz301328]|uniref:pseudouridine synthase n=1 Tax=Uliginosibacterium sp. sgz301328 TaxID=3243764 RepID=UPI00359DE8EF
MLEILYRDEYLVAVHKPAGLLVHRSDLDRHETRFAVQIVRDQIGQPVTPVHRLDRGTSGVLLFALQREALIGASRAFELNKVDKTYLAVVRGWPDEGGTIDHALGRLRDEREFVHAEASIEAQKAITDYRRLATIELPIRVDAYPTSRYALVRLHPHTGRRHQLRRHMKHISHPIVGDATYGKGRHNRMFQEQFDCRRMLLACTGLALEHPVTGAWLRIAARPADDFADVLRRFDWTDALSG